MGKFKKLGAIGLISLLSLFLTACGKPFLSTLQPAGEVAKRQFNLMLLSTGIMVFVIIVVTLIFIIVLVRFRRKDDRIPKQVEGSHKLEIIWTVIPIVLLIILAIPTVIETFRLADVSAMDEVNEEGKTDALVINVRASLFWWEFEYPNEGIVTSQELVVPTDEKVYFNLIASDVKHSFWVPAIGGKMDTNTDNVNRFWLEFNGEKTEEAGGIFYGKCAELCGPSHGLMDFKVKPLPRAEFDAWVKAMQDAKEPREPELASAKQGQEIFNQSCIGCHAVTTNNDSPVALRIGPNLANFGDRDYLAGYLENNKENIVKWLENPDSIKPANLMTGTYGQLTKEQMEALADYLLSLTVEN